MKEITAPLSFDRRVSTCKNTMETIFDTREVFWINFHARFILWWMHLVGKYNEIIRVIKGTCVNKILGNITFIVFFLYSFNFNTISVNNLIVRVPYLQWGKGVLKRSLSDSPFVYHSFQSFVSETTGPKVKT